METAPTTLNAPGIQSKIARKLGVCRATVNAVFRGKYIAGRKLAEKLEQEFIRLGIPLTRWDIMYGVHEGETLADYLKRKKHNEQKEEDRP